MSLMVAGGVIISSCDDQLELTPYDGLTSDQVFTSVSGFQNALRGAYEGFRDIGYYGDRTSQGMLICPDIISDNLIFNPEGRHTHKALYELRNTANDESFALYSRGYLIASRANSILDNIEKLEKGDARNEIEGEALALRALVHFDMARAYCKIPTQSKDAGSSLGLFYATEFDPFSNPSRELNVNQLYEKIVADLEKAEGLVTAKSQVGRLNKNAVAAILSRVYLHQGEYQKSVDAANRVIKAGVPVASREDFAKIWVDEYDDNVLFKIGFTEQDRINIGIVYSQTTEAGIKSEFLLTYEFFKKFTEPDIRKSATLKTSEFGGELLNHVAKYLGRNSGSKNLVDAKFIRMEEVYLNKAEALLALPAPNEKEALDALDVVRANRYKPFKSGNETGQALVDAVQLERRLELAFESDRFFTLKRRGEDIVRSSTEGHLADGKGIPAPKNARVLKAGDHRWQLPIPQDALNQNRNLKQNAGY
ncbi:MAG: RagB/SusD family nutrient uptake outer membrane protein [Cytophagales bacterium]|nr:RagB/SusD family nutrient uptake outer membrane protein [Cytophagales bacterium]